MLTMKIYSTDEGIFDNVEDAIKFMQNTNFVREVSVYDINTEKAYNKAMQILEFVREYNKGKPLNDQILPTSPFAYRGIVGCLGVQAYSIGLGTYENNKNLLVMFGRYMPEILDTSEETPDIHPGPKALTTLAMLGSMLSNR